MNYEGCVESWEGIGIVVGGGVDNRVTLLSQMPNLDVKRGVMGRGVGRGDEDKFYDSGGRFGC